MSITVMSRVWPAVQIILGSIVLASLLGIALDLVTAHVAVEYFTVHHPKVVESKEPLVMALVWGVGASWWFGAIAGLVLAIVNATGPMPRQPKEVLIQVAKACGILWLIFMLILGSCYFGFGMLPIKHDAKFEGNRRIMAVAVTHMSEYVLGAVVLVVLSVTNRRAQRRECSAA